MHAPATAKKLYARLFWPLVTGLLIVIYFPLLVRDPVLNRDDKMLLAPLLQASSWKELVAYLFSPRNPDFQPLRDLSLMADVLLTRALGIGTIHLHSLLLWLACCALAVRLARGWAGGEVSAKAWGLLFAIHPVYTMTVSWGAARKHLLAFLFLLLALHALRALRQAESSRATGAAGAGLCAAYSASLLSQPIYVLLPLWAALLALLDPGARSWVGRHRWAAALAATALGALMLAFLALNYRHYEAYYHLNEQLTGKAEILRLGSFKPPQEALLALGRYFYQLVLPAKLAVLYSPSSPENLAGLALLALFAWAAVQAVGGRKAALGLGFFLLMLALVLAKIQTIFVSDTYALGASLGIWFLAIGMAKRLEGSRWREAAKRVAPAAWALAAAWLFARSATAARTWISDKEMWRSSYEQERSCESSMAHAFLLFGEGRHEEGVEAARFHLRNQCLGEISRPLAYLTLFHEPSLAPARKIELLNLETDHHPSRLVILAALLVESERWPEASQALGALLKREPEFLKVMHGMETAPLLEALRRRCRGVAAPIPYCRLGAPGSRSRSTTRESSER